MNEPPTALFALKPFTPRPNVVSTVAVGAGVHIWCTYSEIRLPVPDGPAPVTPRRSVAAEGRLAYILTYGARCLNPGVIGQWLLLMPRDPRICRGPWLSNLLGKEATPTGRLPGAAISDSSQVWCLGFWGTDAKRNNFRKFDRYSIALREQSRIILLHTPASRVHRKARMAWSCPVTAELAGLCRHVSSDP